MSRYYNPKRTRNLYDSDSDESYRLSRSKIDLFLECPRCFYIDRRLGTKRPPGYPFNLNSAVDELLKKEFDIHRAEETTHPLMEEYGINAVPFQHKKIDVWRDNFKGVSTIHESTNLEIFGAIDDVWINPDDELIVVDYKATSKNSEVNLDADWQITYKRQMEVYQWLLRANDFNVSDTGYFVYANGRRDEKAFDGKLEFDVKIIPYTGSDEWVEETIQDIYECLNSEEIPSANKECDYCAYWRTRKEVTKEAEAPKTLFD